MRILRAVAVASLIGIALAGCTASAAPEPEPTTIPGEPSDAISLVGVWRVSDAEGAAPDTWLRLDAELARVWRECGVNEYAWGARDGVFTAIASGGSCEFADERDPAWLGNAVAYESTADGWALLGDDGTVLAQLADDGAPPTSEAAPDLFLPPQIEARTKLHFQQPVPLPASLTVGDITGRWLLEDLTDNDRVFIEFRSDTWTASDGCNFQGGRWAPTDTGILVVGSGISTAMGCENVDVAPLVLGTTSAGFDGDTLVLVGAAGSELARLVRE